MRLLSPENVKNEKKQGIDEMTKRNNQVASESAQLTKELNLIRNTFEVEKNTILKLSIQFSEEQNKIRDQLINEVKTLEDRRKLAMVPIEELQKETQEKYKSIIEQEKTLLVRQNSLEKKEELADTELENIADKNFEISIREKELAAKELRVEIEEKRVSESLKNVSQKWLELHEKTHILNKQILEKEQDIEIREKANISLLEQINKKEADLELKDRAIVDKYNTLIKAVEEHKKNGFITIIYDKDNTWDARGL